MQNQSINSLINEEWLSQVVQPEQILESHLNNNNWLKRHKQPMIRKGHPLYKVCKVVDDINRSQIKTIETNHECEYILRPLGTSTISSSTQTR